MLLQCDQSSPVYYSCELPGTSKMSPSQCLFPGCSTVQGCLCLWKSTTSSLVFPSLSWRWFQAFPSETVIYPGGRWWCCTRQCQVGRQTGVGLWLFDTFGRGVSEHRSGISTVVEPIVQGCLQLLIRTLSAGHVLHGCCLSGYVASLHPIPLWRGRQCTGLITKAKACTK